MSQLEDEIADVLSKALRGLGKTVEDLSLEGLSQKAWQRAIDGERDEAILRKAANLLGLDPEALIGLPDYMPAVEEPHGVKRLSLPYRSWKVNAWLLEMDGVRLLFDTGWNSNDILDALDGIRPDAVFITHAHEDHVGGVGSVESMGIRVISENEALQAGHYDFGGIGIEVVDLSGHCVPTASYVISGFSKPLWVVGDAIFAGSMGGCKTTENFTMANRTLREGLMRMADETLILPGHGPLTSVADEKKSNPFSPYFS